MKFGIVSLFPPVEKALGLLRLAERLDFDTFWVTDSHVIWNECYSLLGYLVGKCESDTLQFGTMVTNPVSRDPLVIASAFATLRELAGDDRLLCGIGRGDSTVRVLRRRPAKIADLEAAFKLFRGVTSGETMPLDDTTDVHMPWVHGKSIPILGAAYGPKMLQATGRGADGVIIECADPFFIRWALGHIRTGADQVGRDLANFSVVSSTATCVSDDLGYARNKVRPFGAVVGNHVAEVLRNTGANSLPPELEALNKGRTEYDYYKHVHSDSAQSDYVPDEIIDRLCIVGTIERCAERVRELEEVGVTHVNFYAQTDTYEADMEQYSQHILPQHKTHQPAGSV